MRGRCELGNGVQRYHFPMRATPDAQYKQLFAHPEMVRELLCGFVPYAWVQHLDVAVFERVGASYVGDHGQQRHDDMVWRCVACQCLQRAFRRTKIPVGRNLEETRTMMRIQYERYEDLLEEEAIQRGEKVGLERGRQEGLQEGALQASLAFLRLLVLRDLGSVPACVMEVVDTADLATAQGWIERMVNGERADVVLRIQERHSGGN